MAGCSSSQHDLSATDLSILVTSISERRFLGTCFDTRASQFAAPFLLHERSGAGVLMQVFRTVAIRVANIPVHALVWLGV